MLRAPSSVIEPPPALTARVGAEYITAIGKLEDRLLILLDLEKVHSRDEKEEWKQSEKESWGMTLTTIVCIRGVKKP